MDGGDIRDRLDERRALLRQAANFRAKQDDFNDVSPCFAMVF